MPIQDQLTPKVSKLQTTEVQLREEFGFVEPEKLRETAEADPELKAKVKQFVDQLLTVEVTDFRARRDLKQEILGIGSNLQREIVAKSKILRQPMSDLYDAADGGETAKALLALRDKVEELDPFKWNFGPGWFGRLIGGTPIVGDRIRAYIDRFEAAQTVLGSIESAMLHGQEQNKRDNAVLADDQIRFRELTIRFQQLIQRLLLVDQELEERLKTFEAGSERQKSIQEEVLFPLRKRILACQQYLATAQKAVLVYELMIRNNDDLIETADLSGGVMLAELNVAATSAIVLRNQLRTLEMLRSVRETASDLALKTSEQLKTQGAEVQKFTTEAVLEIDKIKAAFGNIRAAMDNVFKYRREALPRMAKHMLEMDAVTREGEEMIQKMEQGNLARPKILDMEVE